jgi:23S rRNA pseudouridine1911/1915/1917 synthase
MTEKFKSEERELLLAPAFAGQRLDQALAQALPEFSRTRLKSWIEAGNVQVNGGPCRPRDVVNGGERITVAVVPAAVIDEISAESIDLAIVHADRDCLVIDKPPGLVVHPGAGNPRHTLQNALLGYDAALAALPRAGLIHRLDKDTSGLLVIARNLSAHTSLTRQLQARSVSREYEAVCVGVMTGGGTIDAPIGRHRSDRLRMTVRSDGRPAVTHYRLIKRYRAHTHVRVALDTGRTHQIRLHFAHLGYPVVGDPTYGRRLVLPKGATAPLIAALGGFKRQALHAASLGFDQPSSGKRLQLHSPLPADLRSLLAVIEADGVEFAE